MTKVGQFCHFSSNVMIGCNIWNVTALCNLTNWYENIGGGVLCVAGKNCRWLLISLCLLWLEFQCRLVALSICIWMFVCWATFQSNFCVMQKNIFVCVCKANNYFIRITDVIQVCTFRITTINRTVGTANSRFYSSFEVTSTDSWQAVEL